MIIAYLLLLATLKYSSHALDDMARDHFQHAAYSRIQKIDGDLAECNAIILNVLFYFASIPIAVQMSPSEAALEMFSDKPWSVWLLWVLKLWLIAGACFSVLPFLRWVKYFFWGERSELIRERKELLLNKVHKETKESEKLGIE